MGGDGSKGEWAAIGGVERLVVVAQRLLEDGGQIGVYYRPSYLLLTRL